MNVYLLLALTFYLRLLVFLVNYSNKPNRPYVLASSVGNSLGRKTCNLKSDLGRGRKF